MTFKIREIQICGQPWYAFTDEEFPQIAVYTEGGPADEIRISVSHGTVNDWVCEGKEGPYFSYQGSTLIPQTHYEIRILARQSGTVSEAKAEFDTGFMKNSWQAHWIEPVQQKAVREPEITFYQIFNPAIRTELDESKMRPAQEIKKEFTLNELPERAVLYATAHGIYEVYVNGKRPDERRLAPEISVYQKRLYYQRYDITGLLKEGKNELLFIVADGWWAGRIGLSGDSCQYGDRLALLAQAELYQNGEKTVLGSDDTFLCRESQIRYADLYIGEKWDLTEEKGEWDLCRISGNSAYPPAAQPVAPVSVLKSLKGKLIRTKKGDLLIDFGQTVAGTVRITLSAAGKREVRLEHCEALDENGEFYQNIVGRNKQQTDVLICETWPVTFSPHFTYHGFRYVRISGVKEEEITSVYADVIGTPISYDGSFSCSDENINQLTRNIRNSMTANFISIPTDCPQREKMGWTGDIQIFTPTACSFADVRGFLENWLANMRLEQRPDGEIPNYIPAFPVSDKIQREAQKQNTSSAWGDACVLVPLYLYRKTGDLSVLSDNLSMMENWLSFIDEACKVKPEGYEGFTKEEKERSRYLWRSGHQFGDWLIPSFQGRENGMNLGCRATGEVISSSFYAVTLEAYLEILDALLASAEEGEAVLFRQKRARAEERLGKVKDAVCEEYVSPDGTVKGNLQGLYVIVLKAGIVQGELAKKTAAKLSELIIQNGTRLDTGFVTTPYLLDVLCDYGYEDLAYQLLFQTEAPSWLYQVKHGATSIWESWEAVLPDGHPTDSSMNHYSLGSVGDFIVRHIGGIRTDNYFRDGITFRPDTDGPVSKAEASVMLPCGKAFCSWERKDGILKVSVCSPVKCRVILGEEEMNLDAGEYRINLTEENEGAEVRKIA